MAALVGVVVFPGSNCEFDVMEAVRSLGGDAKTLWHGDSSVGDVDAVVVPGGFAHGDYLRPGAIARFSPIMAAVEKFAADGGPVVGICNGFQVLTEAGLLPGALQKNRGLKFLCTTVELRVETTVSVLTTCAEAGTILRIPINHFEGNFTCSAENSGAASGGRSDRAPIRREPKWGHGRHRRYLQRGPQRGGVDATSRTSELAVAGLRRRARSASLAPCVGGRRGQLERLIPARFRTAGVTPASRQVAYEMPLRSP